MDITNYTVGDEVLWIEGGGKGDVATIQAIDLDDETLEIEFRDGEIITVTYEEIELYEG